MTDLTKELARLLGELECLERQIKAEEADHVVFHVKRAQQWLARACVKQCAEGHGTEAGVMAIVDKVIGRCAKQC